MARGGTYGVSLTPGFSTFTFDEVFQIFIDLDGDGNFGGTGELLYTSSPSSNTVNGQISIPVTATLGTTRMRITMRYDNPADACDAGFDYGEVEDYCIQIQPEGWVNVDRRLENSLVVYPNPFSSQLNLEFQLEYPSTASVRLFDITGKLVKTVNFEELGAGYQRLEMNTEDLQNGLYLMDLETAGQHERRKLTLLR